MRIRLDSVSVSSVLLTICLLSLVPFNLKRASAWQTRHILVMDRLWILNDLPLIGFASLALVIIGLIVIWTGYQNRMRWSWFIMLVFVCVYFLPMYLVDTFLDIGRVGWHWWPGVVQDAMEGRRFARGVIENFVFLAVWIITLLVPIKAFFGKKSLLPSGDQSKS